MRLVTSATALALLLTSLSFGADEPNKDKPAKDKAAKEKEKPAAEKAPAGKAKPASIQVMLPANATLWLNGEKTTQTGEDRWFVTPPLDPGKNYSATLKITFTRDGNDFSVERKVTLRAGKIAHVHFLPKEHFEHLHEDPARPVVVIAPVRIQESDIPTDWPTDWTGN
jgi:uncharacterized protein (TIGR03000 family)